MYSSGYSQVNRYSPEAQRRMQHRSKGKSCGYYMRIVFFFSSLIQSLIIVSLVLFLLYGKKEDSASTARIQDLEESFSRLSIENVALRDQRKNLTKLLNVTLTNKAITDWDMKHFKDLINVSTIIIHELDRRQQQCNTELIACKFTPAFHGECQTRMSTNCNCGMLTEQLKARLQFVESNLTETTRRMRIEVDQVTKERDYIHLEAIQLRKEKSIQEKDLQFHRQKSKDEFAHSLRGVSNVSKAFLQKIDSLFPKHIAFQLTCPKQREHLEQIRTNCTSLSKEVEDKLQSYLNNVGVQVSEIQDENSRLKAENWRLSEDYRWCSQNRSGLIKEHRENLDKLQGKHDEDKEKLLRDKLRLTGDIDVLQNNVNFKSKEIDYLKDQIKHLNMSCMPKIGFGGSTSRTNSPPQSGGNMFGGGGSSSSSSSSSGGVGQLGRTGSLGAGSNLGSSGSVFNKPVSTGTGFSSSSYLSPGSSPNLSSTGSLFNKLGSSGTGSSSSSSLSPGSSPNLSSTGSLFNKQGSSGTGSSSSSSLSPGSSPNLSSTGSLFNKQGSSGTGSSSSSFLSPGSSPNLSSTGSHFNKPGSGSGSTGSNPSLRSSGTDSHKPALNSRGSSNTGSSSGSVGPNPNLSLSGVGANKPTSNVKTSPGFGSTGSTSKTGSSNSGFTWFGFGSSNSGQSRTGSGTGKESGTSHGGTGSSFGAGRTNGLASGSISVAQHLQELQRIINPPGPEEKQEVSRMLG